MRVPWPAAVGVVAGIYLLFFANPTISALAVLLHWVGELPPVDYSAPGRWAEAAGSVGQIAGAVVVLWLVTRWLALTPAALGLRSPGPRRTVLTVLAASYALGIAHLMVISIRDPEVVTSRPMVVNGWSWLPLVGDVRAGVVEEIVIVAIPVLVGLSAGWSRWWIVGVCAALRVPFHLYQGWQAAPWALLWGGGFAAAFLLWRRLLPLIICHAVYDLSISAVQITGDRMWQLYVLVAGVLVGIVSLMVGMQRQRRPGHVQRIPTAGPPGRG